MRVFVNESVKGTPSSAEALQSRESKNEPQNDRTFKQLKKDWEKFKLMQLRG